MPSLTKSVIRCLNKRDDRSGEISYVNDVVGVIGAEQHLR